MGGGGTQTFSPYQAYTMGMYHESLAHLPGHWGLVDSGSTRWACLHDAGGAWFYATCMSSCSDQGLAKARSSQDESQELEEANLFTFQIISANHQPKQMILARPQIRRPGSIYTPSNMEVKNRGESECSLKYYLIFETYLLQKAFADSSNSSSL